MRNVKRLFRYLKGRYHLFFIGISMLLIIQILNFLTPLIVKAILDDYILGIEYPWVEVATPSEKSVSYHGKYYQQLRDTTETESDASIVIYKMGFYFVNDRIEKGSREISGSELTITAEGKTYIYQVQKLSVSEVVDFYMPLVPKLIFYIVLLFVKSIVVIICTYLQHLSASRAINQIAKDARTDAIRSVERLPISYFEEEPVGKMATRIVHDVTGLFVLYRQITIVFGGALLSFIFAYVGMFLLDAKLALFTFLAYPLIYLWVHFFLKFLKRIAEKVNELRSLLTAKINEIINGINILQIFNFKRQTIDEFNEVNKNFMNQQLKEVKLHITLGWNMINIIRGFVTTIIVAYFGFQSVTFSGIVITAGLIYAYNEYLLKIIEPVNIIFNQVGEFEHAMVQIDRMFKLIEGELEDDEFSEIKRYEGKIEFDNIWFAYKKNDYVLKGVSFSIEPGEFVGLVGHTGSGKSSLMNLLLRFYDITDENSGSIKIDGINIATIPKRTYRTHIGIVLQEPTLFKGTIASNIRFGTNATDEEIESILKSIGGDKIIQKFEQGIHQQISRAGLNMSSGEKQIISLARALVHDPSILIMDEATSHIDTETEAMIKRALEVISRDRTVIVIAHRLSTVYNADKIIVLDHGLKVEEGNHETLLKLNGTYANMYRSQIANVDIQNFQVKG